MEAGGTAPGRLSPDEESAREQLCAAVRRARLGAVAVEASCEPLQRLTLLNYLLDDLPDLLRSLAAAPTVAAEASGPADAAATPAPAGPADAAATPAPAGPSAAPGPAGAGAAGGTPLEEGFFQAEPGGRGLIRTPDRDIAIPEKVVLAARLVEGDRVRLQPDGTMPDGSPHFYFHNLTVREPVRHRTGFVVAEGDRLSVRVGDARVALPPGEAERWGVAPGDVVTVGVQDGGRARLVRVHPVESLPRARQVLRRLWRRVRPTDPGATAPGARFSTPTRVGLIGGHASNARYYHRLFEHDLGADLDFLPGGTYPRYRVEQVVDRARAVILLPQCAGHEMIGVARDRAKALSKPCFTGVTENWSGLLLQMRREVLPGLEGTAEARDSSGGGGPQ